MNIKEVRNAHLEMRRVFLQARVKSQLTQRELAEKARVNRGDISFLECHGYCGPTPLYRLCQALGITIPYGDIQRGFQPFLRKWRAYIFANNFSPNSSEAESFEFNPL